jgi:hypothetical protein
MLDAAELENPIPRVRACLRRGNERAMWRIADRMARVLWCSMAHEDYEVYPEQPWEKLPEGVRMKLHHSMWMCITLVNRIVELAPTR